jgi:hypothetical protein
MPFHSDWVSIFACGLRANFDGSAAGFRQNLSRCSTLTEDGEESLDRTLRAVEDPRRHLGYIDEIGRLVSTTRVNMRGGSWGDDVGEFVCRSFGFGDVALPEGHGVLAEAPG